ncbi:MAG TPA: AAA family ATPase [Puia sp.]|jgi:NadR type nicotinamide-nucleotide adenylyltransferase|nr:AAA family ATPase [Puia sp.]
MPLRKVVVIGPESTGKSSLCEALAVRFHSEWVREYAREYLEEHGMGYEYETLATIARGQLALEDKVVKGLGTEAGAARGDGLLFIDTDLYVIKVWSEYVFGRCEAWVLDEIVRRKYDAYLLCNTDLPWAHDPLREYPDPGVRERLYHIYKDLLVNQSLPWAEVSGVGDERLEGAIAAVERLFG